MHIQSGVRTAGAGPGGTRPTRPIHTARARRPGEPGGPSPRRPVRRRPSVAKVCARPGGPANLRRNVTDPRSGDASWCHLPWSLKQARACLA
eukprot:8411877-Lingulodinium_polyedra.AAC.1